MNKFVLLGVGAILLVTIAGLLWQQGVLTGSVAENANESEVAGCTKEALLCPDGSTVARSGSECRMDSCPAVDLLEGKVFTQEGGYWLSTAAPDTVAGATYSLPLAGQEDVLASLVRAQVRVEGRFGEGNILMVNSVEELMTDQTVKTVGVGETAFINGLKITLLEVVQENRCPSDMECMEGGAITASFTLVSDTETLTRNIASDEVPTPFDVFTIAIEEIAPPLLAEIEPDPAAYQLTLRVRNIND